MAKSIKKTAKKVKQVNAKKAVKKIAKPAAKKVQPKLKKKVEKKKTEIIKSKGSMTNKNEKKTVKKTETAKKTESTKKTVTAKKTEPEIKKPVVKEEKKKHDVNHKHIGEVVVVSPKKVVRKIKGYGKEDLEAFKKVILDKRTEILEQLQNLKEQMMDPSTGQYVNENSPYSLHMAEQGTDAMEREKIFLWAQRENKFLGYLDDALHRIETGTYGICIECIDEPQNLCPTCPLVPKERLMAVPHTQLCLQVKQKQEKGK